MDQNGVEVRITANNIPFPGEIVGFSLREPIAVATARSSLFSNVSRVDKKSSPVHLCIVKSLEVTRRNQFFDLEVWPCHTFSSHSSRHIAEAPTENIARPAWYPEDAPLLPPGLVSLAQGNEHHFIPLPHNGPLVYSTPPTFGEPLHVQGWKDSKTSWVETIPIKHELRPGETFFRIDFAPEVSDEEYERLCTYPAPPANVVLSGESEGSVGGGDEKRKGEENNKEENLGTASAEGERSALGSVGPYTTYRSLPESTESSLPLPGEISALSRKSEGSDFGKWGEGDEKDKGEKNNKGKIRNHKTLGTASEAGKEGSALGPAGSFTTHRSLPASTESSVHSPDVSSLLVEDSASAVGGSTDDEGESEGEVGLGRTEFSDWKEELASLAALFGGRYQDALERLEAEEEEASMARIREWVKSV